MLRFTITLTYGDYLASNLLYQRRYWFWTGLLKVFGLGGLTFFALMWVFAVLENPPSWDMTIVNLVMGFKFGLGMMIFIPILSVIMMLLSAKRTFNELSLGLPVAYEIDQSGFRAANTQNTSNLAWDDIRDFVQDNRLLMVRRTRRLFFPLPKSQLAPAELEEVLGILRAAGVKEG